MPKTCLTPQATIVSAMTSVTVRACSALGRDAHLDAVVADLDGVRGGLVVEPARRAAGERAVVVAVPRATQQAVLDRALAERAALVRAAVVERAVATVVVGQRDRLAPCRRPCSRGPRAARPGRRRDARSARACPVQSLRGGEPLRNGRGLRRYWRQWPCTPRRPISSTRAMRCTRSPSTWSRPHGCTPPATRSRCAPRRAASGRRASPTAGGSPSRRPSCTWRTATARCATRRSPRCARPPASPASTRPTSPTTRSASTRSPRTSSASSSPSRRRRSSACMPMGTTPRRSTSARALRHRLRRRRRGGGCARDVRRLAGRRAPPGAVSVRRPVAGARGLAAVERHRLLRCGAPLGVARGRGRPPGRRDRVLERRARRAQRSTVIENAAQ